jgi:hypothetical protein
VSRSFRIYLLVLFFCLATGLASLFFAGQLPFIKNLDEGFLRHLAEVKLKKDLVLVDSKEDNKRSRTLLEPYEHAWSPELFQVDFDLRSESLPISLPPKASDMALVFDELRAKGVTNLHLTTLFNAEEEEQALNQIVQNVFSPKNDPPLENVLIPLKLTRSASSKSFPPSLLRSSVPLSRIAGDPNKIPVVNRMIFSPFNDANFSSENTLPVCVSFGFTNIESEETPPGKVFLMAKWDGHIIFNQLLLSSMILHKVKPSDLTIVMGDKISLGKGKPELRIDAFGCTPLIDLNPPLPKLIQAEELFFSEKDSDLLKNLPKHALITSTAKDDINIQLIASPYSRIFQFYQFKNFRIAETYLRLPHWLEASLLFEFALIGACFSALAKPERLVAYVLLLVSIVPLHLFLIQFATYWVPLSPFLVVILVSLFTNLLAEALFKPENLKTPNPETDLKNLHGLP